MQQIVDFVIDNYDNADNYLFPQNVDELVKKDGDSEVFMIEDEYGISSLCFVRVNYKHHATVYRTVVRMDVREQGLSKQLDEVVENTLRNSGVKKIESRIYVNNYPSIFRRLKRGFLVEGLMRNQDGKGKDTYLMGKEL